jgi:hypothetical protein
MATPSVAILNHGTADLGIPERVRLSADTPIDAIGARLLDAAQGNVDPLADIAPIEALLEQGCDLDADILPVVARTVPELPRLV